MGSQSFFVRGGSGKQSILTSFHRDCIERFIVVHSCHLPWFKSLQEQWIIKRFFRIIPKSIPNQKFEDVSWVETWQADSKNEWWISIFFIIAANNCINVSRAHCCDLRYWLSSYSSDLVQVQSGWKERRKEILSSTTLGLHESSWENRVLRTCSQPPNPSKPPRIIKGFFKIQPYSIPNLTTFLSDLAVRNWGTRLLP